MGIRKWQLRWCHLCGGVVRESVESRIFGADGVGSGDLTSPRGAEAILVMGLRTVLPSPVS